MREVSPSVDKRMEQTKEATEGKPHGKTRQNPKRQNLEGRKQRGKSNREDRLEGVFGLHKEAEGLVKPPPP